MAAGANGRQTTIADEVSVRGVGYVHGADVTVRFKPAEANAGIEFVRTDLPGQPRVKVDVDNVSESDRRTSLTCGTAIVEMTEHVLSALAGVGIDNCVVELDAAETPGMDGSATAFVDALQSAGLQSLHAKRQPFVVSEPLSVHDGDAILALHPGPTDHLRITYTLEYPPPIGRESYSVAVAPDRYAEEIAPARTFILEQEIEQLRARGLGKRTTAKDLIVFGNDGAVIDNTLRFEDECVRHKILDVIGDLALFGRPVYGQILAHKSGHRLNASLAAKLKEQAQAQRQMRWREDTPLLDSAQIEKIVPHRYPFLLVDRVVELDPNHRAVGIKNVSYNEPFFQGHWPSRPVMPGVLIVEAMAQLAGIMLTQFQEGDNYGMLVSMTGIKLRQPVVPGDQLWLYAESVRLKSRAAVVKTRAEVGQKRAAEAQISLVLVEPDKESS